MTEISFRKKIALELFRKFRRNTTQHHQLNYILWESTLRCNLNCRHCGSECKKESVVKDMPIKDFLAAIDSLGSLVEPNKTMIVFTGGEALMRKDVEACGIELYQRGFPWGLVSNGYLLSEERLKALLNAGLRAVTISLDGLELSHNWLRNNSMSFDKAVQAISMLQQVKNLRYDVVTCVNQKNYNELDMLKKLLLQLGVKEWRIFTIFPIGRAKDSEQLQLTPIQFKGVFDFIKQTRQENSIKLSYGCEGFLGDYEGEVRDSFFFCRAGINVASVLADGSISACPDLRNNFIQGNIYTDNFADVWQNKFNIFRDRSWTKTGICAECDVYKYCEGNGMHLRNENDGSLLFCHLHRIEDGVK